MKNDLHNYRIKILTKSFQKCQNVEQIAYKRSLKTSAWLQLSPCRRCLPGGDLKGNTGYCPGHLPLLVFELEEMPVRIGSLKIINFCLLTSTRKKRRQSIFKTYSNPFGVFVFPSDKARSRFCVFPRLEEGVEWKDRFVLFRRFKYYVNLSRFFNSTHPSPLEKSEVRDR